MPRAIVVSLLLAIVSTPTAAAAEDAAPLTASPEDLAWWRDARFGLFIHWGPVSLKGTEIGWSRGRQVPVEEYDNLYKRFNPTKFDADAWVRTAKRAGMKYLVITSKHHDGFSLWDSAVTEYDIAATPFQRDVLAELSEACKRHGLVFSVYYSICDWHHPDYPRGSPGGKTAKPNPDMDRYVRYMHAQLREIVTRYYGDRGVLWFDGEWEKPWNADYARETVRLLRGLKPDLLINNRVGKGRHGMKGTTRETAVPGDFDTPEQTIGRFQTGRPWESCITICRQWAWKPDDTMKSLAECVRTLVRCAGGDGNLLLNVGPMPDGRIEPRQVERLEEIGAWLDSRGESVYGTRGGPFKPGPYGASTRKGNRIYLHVFQWQDGAVRLPPIGPTVTAARVLGGGKAEVEQTDEGLAVRAGEADRHAIDTVVVLDLDGPAMAIEPLDVPVPAASK
ncbi:MAG: alpha-L-fucosidase [Phycisphaerae bacterium]